MREYELSTLFSFPKMVWTCGRHESQRIGRMIRKWKKENPKATTYQEMLAESLFRLHVWEQRLCDNRYLFSGQRTDYQPVSDHKADVDSEDLKTKRQEWDKYMPLILKWKGDLLKLAMASSISVNIDGDGNIHNIFSALSDAERQKLKSYRSNGGRSAVGDNGQTETSAQ
jgi:hypothetical protein